MKIEIGQVAERPLLTVKFKTKMLNDLADRPGFSELNARLLDCPDIRVERESKAESFTLLAKKVGRRPVNTHESYLRPFVRLLEWGCIAQGKQQQLVTPYRLDNIETEPSLNGSYRTESSLFWPTKKDKQMSELATTAMQAFGEQLRYGSFRRPGDYDREVFVNLDRIPPKHDDDFELRQLTVHTATDLKGNMRVNSEMKDNGRWVEVGGNYIRSHKEQLIHLVGAVAVAYADSIE